MNKQYPAARQLRFTPAGKNRGCHHCRPASHNHINGAQNPLVSNDECSATSHVKLTCVASPRHHPSSPTNHSRPIPLWFQKGHGQSGRGVAQRRGSPARRRLEIPVLPSPPAAHTLALTASRLVALRKGKRVKSWRRVRAGNPEGKGVVVVLVLRSRVSSVLPSKRFDSVLPLTLFSLPPFRVGG
jgi:hypothetical protein